jgi:hypothetical protein
MGSSDDVHRMYVDRMMLVAKPAHKLGGFVLAASVFGVVSWLWQVLRQQQRFSGSDFGGLGGDGGLNRIDVITSQTFSLVFAAIGLAAGMALRLFARYVQTTTKLPR